MASRPLIIASLLGASVGVPYIASHSSLGQNAANQPPSAMAGAGSRPDAAFKASPVTTTINPSFQYAGLNRNATAARLDGAQFNSVAQVLRFDVTKEWVYSNWSRKLTGPTDVGLFSVRVPLVMGTQLTALAGSLTYFFNSQGQVEHISFRGRTGDTTPLVQLLTRSYQFQRVEASSGEQLYRVQNGEQVQSELRTRPESVLRSNSPQQNIVVELEFARPGSQRVLPPHGPTLQIPHVAAPPVAVATQSTNAAGSAAASAKSAASSYFNGVRYASPAEEGQVLWKRWPD